MRIVFFGSDDFAAVHLEALIMSRYEVVAVVTQPDKPKGRGMKVILPPPKDVSNRYKVKVLQPSDIKNKEFFASMKALDADIFVVIAYGKFLPYELLALPKVFPINVHGSLLPKLRGAAPINWAVINGEKETGISVAKINSKMDSGDILLNKKIKIESEDTAYILRKKMMEVGPKLLLEAIDLIAKKECISSKQNESQVTFAPKLTKELGNIDWRKPAVEVQNLIRGMVPWPTAYTFLKGKQLKILKADIVCGDPCCEPGGVFNISKEGFAVQTGDGALFVKEVHLESSKQMNAENFLIGHKITLGLKFPN